MLTFNNAVAAIATEDMILVIFGCSSAASKSIRYSDATAK